VDHLDQLQQRDHVVEAHGGSIRTERNERVRLDRVRPTGRKPAQPTLPVAVIDPILSPGIAVVHKLESLAA